MTEIPTKTIEHVKESLNICDHSVEEWKQEALEHLENIDANFSLHSMNPTGGSRLYGEHRMLKAMINFIKNN